MTTEWYNTGAVTADASELNVLDGQTSLTATEVGLIDGSLVGTVVASKAAIYDAAGKLLRQSATVAAAGTTIADATAMTAELVAVTGANGSAGVILPVAAANATVTVINTNASNALLVYPVSGSQINALGASNAFTITAGQEGTFIARSATLWYVAAATDTVAGLTSSAAELNLNDGSIAGTAVASKTLALGANKNVDVLAIADGGFSLGAGAGTAVLATAVEINNACDDSQKTQAIITPGAITVDGTKRRVTLTNNVNGAVTIAAPSAAMMGKTLVIEYIGAGTNATTIALTNVQGGSAATTASFNAANETLVLIGGELKWTVLKEVGVTLS